MANKERVREKRIFACATGLVKKPRVLAPIKLPPHVSRPSFTSAAVFGTTVQPSSSSKTSLSKSFKPKSLLELTVQRVFYRPQIQDYLRDYDSDILNGEKCPASSYFLPIHCWEELAEFAWSHRQFCEQAVEVDGRNIVRCSEKVLNNDLIILAAGDVKLKDNGFTFPERILHHSDHYKMAIHLIIRKGYLYLIPLNLFTESNCIYALEQVSQQSLANVEHIYFKVLPKQRQCGEVRMFFTSILCRRFTSLYSKGFHHSDRLLKMYVKYFDTTYEYASETMIH